MRKTLFILSTVLALYACVAKGQVVPAQDTVHVSNTVPNTYVDYIIPHDSTLRLQWKIIANTFPADWISNSGICDNILCYMTDVIATPGMTHATGPYALDSAGTFLLALDFTSVASPGPYYITIGFSDLYDPNATILCTETFIYDSLYGLGVAGHKLNTQTVSLYPNPAKSNMTISVSDVMSVQAVAIYDIYGRLAAKHLIAGNTTSIDVSALSSGTYFVRFLNSENEVLTTRKFLHL